MPAFLKRLRTRTSERIDRAAVGSPQPAGSEPVADASPGEGAKRPSARERGAMRRRLRKLVRLREAMLFDLGALTFEMLRQDRRNPRLVADKAGEVLAVDTEARALAEALDSERPLAELTSAGIAGTCSNCATILGGDARYCSNCGTPVAKNAERPAGQGGDGDGHGQLNGNSTKRRAAIPWADGQDR